MSENIIITSDDNFAADVLKSNIPVLVDFWADWCGPCKSIASTLEEVATEYKGKVKVAKLNVDENTDTPVKYNVRGIPTLILFKGGEEVDTKVGALTKSDLIAFLDNSL